MKYQNVKQRTKHFAHNCVKLASLLQGSNLKLHIYHQLIRCSTSVAANYRASCLAMSKKAYISKLSIAIEEVDETTFWLEFLIDENLIEEESAQALFNEAKELTAIFISSRKTAQSNMVKEDHIDYSPCNYDIQ